MRGGLGTSEPGFGALACAIRSQRTCRARISWQVRFPGAPHQASTSESTFVGPSATSEHLGPEFRDNFVSHEGLNRSLGLRISACGGRSRRVPEMLGHSLGLSPLSTLDTSIWMLGCGCGALGYRGGTRIWAEASALASPLAAARPRWCLRCWAPASVRALCAIWTMDCEVWNVGLKLWSIELGRGFEPKPWPWHLRLRRQAPDGA